MRNFFEGMLECKKKIYESRNRKAADVYLELEKFVRGGGFSNYKGSAQLSGMLLNRVKTAEIAGLMGLNPATVRYHRKELSDALLGMFGAGVFEELLEDPNSVRDMLNTVTFGGSFVGLTDLVPSEVIRSVRELGERTEDSETLSLTVDDCVLELDFLARYGIEFMRSELSDLDREKLLFLFDCIDRKRGTLKERKYILNTLGYRG